MLSGESKVEPGILFRFGTSETKKTAILRKGKLGKKNVLIQKMRSLTADI